jgi:hypothetical protein
MIRHAVIALGLTAALAAPGSSQQNRHRPTDQERLDKTLAGLVPGKPVHCLSHYQATETQTYENTILYVQGRNKVWRNDPSGGCMGLRHDDILVTRTTSSQFCRGDIVETRSRTGGFTTGSCSLGDFVPYTRPGSRR